MFTSQDVVALRQKTGAGMMDCKKALTETDGNMEKAVDYLREKGIASAAKKSQRIASQGLVNSYIHLGGKVGVLIEVNCETDFVAKSDEFKDLVHNIAMHIAAAKPSYIVKEEIPAEVVAKEKEILKAQALNEPKPKPVDIIDKMVEGRVSKFYKEICLLEQDYVKDPAKTVAALINESIGKIGEKITVRRFVRYEMGEGLEKKRDTFADEIQDQLNKMNNE
ncbi:MAG: translation elongation factor Ts [Clostridiales bacterium]|jgi:elongation factor Ts|nr:translation elongation factor Ts [Clostridiales bacterium]